MAYGFLSRDVLSYAFVPASEVHPYEKRRESPVCLPPPSPVGPEQILTGNQGSLLVSVSSRSLSVWVLLIANSLSTFTEKAVRLI